jgi:hypothetical protein
VSTSEALTRQSDQLRDMMMFFKVRAIDARHHKSALTARSSEKHGKSKPAFVHKDDKSTSDNRRIVRNADVFNRTAKDELDEEF